MRSTRVGRAVLVGVLAGALFAACATGNQLDGTGVGGGFGGGAVSSSRGSGTPEAGPGDPIGSPCSTQADCKMSNCLPVGPGKYCTIPCSTTIPCPNGTYCSIIEGMPLCTPDLGQECAVCSVASDCKMPSDNCLTAPLGDKFCARDCTVDGVCPNGFVCVGASYPDGGTGTGAGGSGGATAASSSSSSGGGAGGNGAGTGGIDAGGPLPTMPTMWCAPGDGTSCQCNETRNGVMNSCVVTNSYGTCAGMQTCNGVSGTFTGCTAQTPAMETCNGKDDNCNGRIDEGDPNVLCEGQGPPPPNASWVCWKGLCEVGACDPGYTNFPPGGSVTAGCACQVDTNGPNGTCATAHDMGMVTSVSATPIVISGTLSSAGDVEFFTFNTVDTPQTNTNSYHVSIAFTEPSPNNEFVMDVMRGAPCIDAPTGPATSITSYDWCVNGSGPTSGEAPCGPGAVNDCTDYTSVYYVRVYRAAGVAGTCTTFQLTVTGGGGTCDLTQTCP
jgi:hypothetical protein